MLYQVEIHNLHIGYIQTKRNLFKEFENSDYNNKHKLLEEVTKKVNELTTNFHFIQSNLDSWLMGIGNNYFSYFAYCNPKNYWKITITKYKKEKTIKM